nr:MAG TPA: hypothetical protein [Caudoviricetes sp.]
MRGRPLISFMIIILYKLQKNNYFYHFFIFFIKFSMFYHRLARYCYFAFSSKNVVYFK